MLRTAPNLADQIYDAIVDEICDGRLPAGFHLVQEDLASRFGVSRQPVQQAMARLKADNMVEEVGRRGQFVASLDLVKMHWHYGVRAALDAWAARVAAERLAGDHARADDMARRGREILAAGRHAVAGGDVVGQVAQDRAFHHLIYEASGNPLIASTAEPHWRFLRRVMAAVLLKARMAETVWTQHTAILDAVLAGDAEAAEHYALVHIDHASQRLMAALDAGDAP